MDLVQKYTSLKTGVWGKKGRIDFEMESKMRERTFEKLLTKVLKR